MRKQASGKCQAKILDAADRAFAVGGYSGTSMRVIVRQAGVNLATVYYYFGSKGGLMEAVLKRRFGPLRREHLEVLKQFEDDAGGQPLPVEKILEAINKFRCQFIAERCFRSNLVFGHPVLDNIVKVGVNLLC